MVPTAGHVAGGFVSDRTIQARALKPVLARFDPYKYIGAPLSGLLNAGTRQRIETMTTDCSIEEGL